jgi:hypothetical protein
MEKVDKNMKKYLKKALKKYIAPKIASYVLDYTSRRSVKLPGFLFSILHRLKDKRWYK